jgi:hypothetical protein
VTRSVSVMVSGRVFGTGRARRNGPAQAANSSRFSLNVQGMLHHHGPAAPGAAHFPPCPLVTGPCSAGALPGPAVTLCICAVMGSYPDVAWPAADKAQRG